MTQGDFEGHSGSLLICGVSMFNVFEKDLDDVEENRVIRTS